MIRITSTPTILFSVIVSLFSFRAARGEGGAKSSGRAGWEDSTFKNWYFTPNAVFGRAPIARIKHRSYYRISRKTDGSVTVLSFNPAGIVVNTTVVWYAKGKLRLVAQSGRWNEPQDSTWYKSDGEDEFLVTEKIRGMNPFYPCKAARYTFKNNLLREILFLSDSTRPGANRDGVSHCIFDRYDDPKRFGLIRSETYFNEIDLPVVSRSMGVHKVINEFDENTNLISRSVFGLDDKPTLDLMGAFREKYKYDDDDNEKEIDYFGEKGSLVSTEMGYAQVVRYYSKGFVEKEKFYDDNNQLVRGAGIVDSAAIIGYEHDEQGNLTETAYFGPDEAIVANTQGIHRWAYTYSPEGMLTGSAIFGVNAHALADEEGVHWYKYQRDKLGQITSVSFVNKFGVPSNDLRDGAFLRKYSYDNWGRCFSISFWQDDSTKTNCVERYHESVVQFNEDGKVNEADYYDDKGRITSGLMGYSRQRITYNEQGLVDERRFFNGDQPALVHAENAYTSNFHQIRYEYDIPGRLRSLAYYDQAGRPLNATVAPVVGKEMPCQRVEFGYDRGRIVNQKIHDSGDISTPVFLDCIHGNCLAAVGFGLRDPRFTVVRMKGSFNGRIRTDSVFYNDELSFINKDSVLLFLNAGRSALEGIACATFYRVAKLNKYYQLEGVADDYYLVNDSLAARLTYSAGRLNGPCTLFYANGNIQERGTYSDNARSGAWDYYFENGQKAKTVFFTDQGAFLMDCFNENGEVLAQKGNGRFEGTIVTGAINNQLESKMIGMVKNGLPDGQWTYYNKLLPGPAGVEQFMAGKFLHGTSYSLTGTRAYDRNPLGRVESLHPLEFLDYFGYTNFCLMAGKSLTIDVSRVFYQDPYAKIGEGIRQILKSGRYGEYSGWVLLDLHYDENGQIVAKSVRLYQQNNAFEKDILAMLDGLNDREKLILDKKGTAFEKFFVVLVDANETVIPEELLVRQRTVSR
jgi:antitoxin component YwqK of YwqJK toxin-antitoxin module